MRLLLVFAFLAVLAGCQQTSNTPAETTLKLPQGITLVSSHRAQQGLGLDYNKYRLDNGLTVILHEDHSDPMVHVDVTYHVGSAREEPGKSGFAHFFEHMMFQGSKHVADEQHFELITEAGGDMNGTTNNDRTNYYQTVPANQLEKVLWLEADRMGYLLPAVTQEKFEVQRETVKNERAQRVDNQPYGLRRERIMEALYPQEHPYSWPVIGYIEDLNRVDVEDLKRFFQRWYGPNNAVLTIGGAINQQQVLRWVVKYFGTIPAGPIVKDMAKKPVSLSEDRYLTIEDDVHLPLLQLTFPTVHVRHGDEAPLDVLADILGGGKTSLFYKNLVKDGYAVHAGVGHPCMELACNFELVALPNPQRVAHLSELEGIIRATLAEFEQRGVNEDDLARTKASIRSGTIYGLQSVAGKVSTLAYNETFAGEPDLVQYDIERYENVNKEDVMRVYRRYIKNKSSIVLSIVPNGQSDIEAKAANFEIPERQLTNNQNIDKPFKAPKVKADSFDRSKIPGVGPNPVISVPAYWQSEFDNGLKLIGHRTSETPTVSISLNIEGGPLLDPIDKSGLAVMTAGMMQEATKNFSNEEMENALRKLGSSIHFSAAGRFTFVQVNSLTENLDETLALLKEKLLNPAFDEADFVRLQQRSIQGLQQSLKNPEVLASHAVKQVLYGSQNRIALPDSGSLATLSNITLGDVKSFYQNFYNPYLASAIVVGEIAQNDVLEKLAFLREWQPNRYQIPDYNTFPAPSTDKVYLVDDEQSAQTIVKVVKRSLPYDALGEHFKTKLMNFPLGGHFNSRLNLNLREDKGYTYGARTNFLGGKTLGMFEFSSAVNKQHTVATLQEVLNELEQFRKYGISEAEMQLMRNAYTQGDALKFETPMKKAGFLRHLMIYQLDNSYADKQNAIINTISARELNQLAKEQLQLQDMEIILVGNKADLGEELAEFAASIDRELIELTW
ncbi:MAG: M16 family metallopeptidase [Aestuariibacter sp.]